MRYYTGNAVDLDTTVLRTNDLATLAAVNAMNQKARESSGKRGKAPAVYENSKQFAASAQAGEIARHAASDLLARFAADFGLTKADVLRRAVDHTNLKHIPVARSNADRGKHPLWRYRNAGQDSFHANVPHLDDVIGALLKAPLHAARVYIRIHVLFGSDPEELDRRLDAFYTDCIADACFNQKWRAVEDFERSMSHEGRIVGVLERLQKENQRDFFRIMDDDDDECTREREHMWALACGRSGRDSAGRIRAVTRADVDAWVADPAAVI
ncbi:hypothetical protein DIPPA_15421 [Diplonema papillatum]|nr:hypothetical protein DIPPA_15421 [Diplonema papillatum]